MSVEDTKAFAPMRPVSRHPSAVELAVWFHDVIHGPRAVNDEEASAVLAEWSLTLVGAAPATVAEVARLVRLTATHDPRPHDVASRALARLLARSRRMDRIAVRSVRFNLNLPSDRDNQRNHPD